ncbi:type II secretion system protein [Cyanobium gracile]|uniref:Prepilin-type N-terminal cleavage/methylation domain-containing protein n=1 Tax=Cyanobium gracile (strain ATCC 27147 / PCC 6307) TaxID=292564 RepID=K9P5V8_CYAGP|nr:prepilin-type N-terminal cleavage/methylation domain-containing protein [Cyanobium gracile PCC 6307]
MPNPSSPFRRRRFFPPSYQRQARGWPAPVRTGFTLLELMVVVSIVGTISAVVLPNYLRARSSAEAGASIGESLGIAKNCAVGMISRIPTEGTEPRSGNAFTCDGTRQIVFFSRSWSGDATGVRCLSSVASRWTSSALFIVGQNGLVTCYL